ncbi:MAG: hypothetical protein ACREFL_22010 [Stellaceae bacterium]
MRTVAQPADLSRKPFMDARNQDKDECRAMPRSAPIEGRAKGLHDYYEEPDDPLKLSLKNTLIELAMTLGGILGVFFLIVRLVQFLHGGAAP